MAGEAASNLVLFIASIIVATATAGVLTGVILNLTDDVAQRGDGLADRLSSEVRIVNDPTNVVASPTTKFYVQNVGETTLSLDEVTVILDGVPVTTTNTLLGGETDFAPGVVAELVYGSSTGAGDHTVRVVFENGVSDSMKFRV